MSGLPQYQVGDKQEWCGNRNYILLQFATLPTCSSFCDNLSAFNKTYRYIRQHYQQCMSWCFITWYIYKTQQGSHCETVELWDMGLLKLVCGAVRKIPTCLWFSVIWRWGLLQMDTNIHELNDRCRASQQLLFLLTNEMTCREISILYC
jgi:hypothetical protein